MTGGVLRAAAPCGDGSPGIPSAPRIGPSCPAEALPPRESPGYSPEVGTEGAERPARVGSLPSGRSAISLRFIGHARPGIRAEC